jgi:hypothetical protein
MSSAKKLTALACLCIAVLAASAASAQADFGLVPDQTKVTALSSNGTIDDQASSHPGAFTVQFELNANQQGQLEGGRARDVLVDPPIGLIGNPNAVPACPRQSLEGTSPKCPTATQVGVLEALVVSIGRITAPIYNIAPPPGVPAQFGFTVGSENVLQYASVLSEAGYGLRVSAVDVPLEIRQATETIWGVPADPANDAKRFCRNSFGNLVPPCGSTAPVVSYLTLPATCEPMKTGVQVDSVLAPGLFVSQVVESLDPGGNPLSLTGCDAVPFAPEISSQPTSKLAANPSGLDFNLKLPNQGLEAPGGISETEPSKVVVSLPDGLSINPSLAEGVGTCSPAQFKAEQLESKPGEGCPEASKLGSVVVKTPLIDETIEGSLFLATPYENEFGTLGAIYMALRGPERGILVKQAGKVEFDAKTGQITTTFEGLPPVPFSSFKLHFREGARAPLATPQACGEYVSRAKLTPFSVQSDSEAVERTASFEIERGSEGGACPSGGTPPFHPGLIAGSINNAAGAYSPFNVRIFRNDAEQEITHFSIKLPPGVTGKLAGIPFCSDQQITAAKARERQPHGGTEELNSPSCPQASEVGHTLVGAGVGNSLTYVPGKVYLAGPYHGDSLSIVAITAAKAGPFDLGTVVIREGLEINPETAEVFVDATGSDPIPHIIAGIPVHLRDVRVYIDRSDFMLNPTNCEPTSTASTVLGAGTDFASEADDRPVTVTSRYQAADCASLNYKPRIALKLKGSTKRSGNPALTAILRPRPGDANSQKISVALPHSEFLDQGHIKTICTRVQFKAGTGNGSQCPAASVYGHAKVWTPLLAQPLEGPVFLRSSEHQLPDIVLALHGLIDFDAVGRVDSVNGGIRNSFELVPDAPIEKVELALGGGKKSLLENSTNLCVGSHKATAKFQGQNGRAYSAQVPLQAQCKGKGTKKAKRRARSLLELLNAW